MQSKIWSSLAVDLILAFHRPDLGGTLYWTNYQMKTRMPLNSGSASSFRFLATTFGIRKVKNKYLWRIMACRILFSDPRHQYWLESMVKSCQCPHQKIGSDMPWISVNVEQVQFGSKFSQFNDAAPRGHFALPDWSWIFRWCIGSLLHWVANGIRIGAIRFLLENEYGINADINEDTEIMPRHCPIEDGTQKVEYGAVICCGHPFR